MEFMEMSPKSMEDKDLKSWIYKTILGHRVLNIWKIKACSLGSME
jgi:hypothetical protein